MYDTKGYQGPLEEVTNINKGTTNLDLTCPNKKQEFFNP